MDTNNTSSNTSSNSSNSSNNNPLARASERQIKAWLKSWVGVYDRETTQPLYGGNVTFDFLLSLFREGVKRCRILRCPDDGSRYFWTAAGQLVRIYSRSLIKALRVIEK
jgi:hypothetical protein